VFAFFVEIDLLAQLADDAVDANPRVAVFYRLLEKLLVFALAPAHHRREHLKARPFGKREDLVDDLLRRLRGDLAPAIRAVRLADARVQQTEVVVDLCDRADGRPRVAARRLLIDGDGRRQPLDVVDVRLFHLAEELARVR